MLFNINFKASFLDIVVALVAMFMALFVAMPFHEFAHALAAKREGDYTAVAMKRYTLAPFAHFDWQGFMFLVLFGFGWAKPVPIDERNFKHGNRSKFAVSIAGIATNLALGTVFLFIEMLILRFAPTFFISNLYGKLLYNFLEFSVIINFVLAFFNLLPIYPLDGYNVIDSFCKTDNAFLRFMRKYSFLIYFVILITGLFDLYFNFTGNFVIVGLTKLFELILG